MVNYSDNNNHRSANPNTRCPFPLGRASVVSAGDFRSFRWELKHGSCFSGLECIAAFHFRFIHLLELTAMAYPTNMSQGSLFPFPSLAPIRSSSGIKQRSSSRARTPTGRRRYQNSSYETDKSWNPIHCQSDTNWLEHNSIYKRILSEQNSFLWWTADF
jgi:hypothetical protein